MNDDDDRLVIESVTNSGQRFRPSDWIERVSAVLASFDANQRLRYSSQVQPCMIGGQKCLVVSQELKRQNPDAFDYVMQFANDNNLRIQEDRRSERIGVEAERRSSHSAD